MKQGLAMTVFFSVLLFATGVWAQANPTPGCEPQSFRNPEVYLYRMDQGNGRCFVTTVPMIGYHYRSPKFHSEGRFMIFNSYENESASDGARSFFLFPRTRLPFLEEKDDHIVFHSATDGIALLYAKEGYKILGMTGGDLIQDPKIHPNNKGGIEIRNVQALVLDTGFLLHEDPTSEPNRTAHFIDMKGNRCAVKIRDVFRYENVDNPRFKFTDAQLKTYLKTKCPKIVVPY